MTSFEEKFCREFPDCHLEIETVSKNLERFRVYVGNILCAESGDRDFAFRWALEDVNAGIIALPPRVEQLVLLEFRS